MKKNAWILGFLSLFIVLSYCIYSLSQKEKIVRFQQAKPCVPEPIFVKSRELQDPWVERDVEQSLEICQKIQIENPDFTEKNLKEILAEIQKTVPFIFPEGYYNLVCLPEESQEYQIYQRLYLGKTELGLPFYLDVRVFSIKDKKEAEKIVSKFLQKEESFEEKAYFVSGKKRSYHGFATLEQGLFFYPILKGDLLYMAYAEGPLDDFKKFVPFFESIKIK